MFDVHRPAPARPERGTARVEFALVVVLVSVTVVASLVYLCLH